MLSKGLSRVFSNTTVQKHQFFTHTHIHQEITKREMECMNRIKNELPNTSNNTNTGRLPLNNDIKSTVPPGNMEQDQSWIEK